MFHHTIYRAPGGKQSGSFRAEDAENRSRHRRCGTAHNGIYSPIAFGRQYGAGVELTARAVNVPRGGAVLPITMAITAYEPGRTAMHHVTWTIISHCWCGCKLETEVDNAVKDGLHPDRAKILRDIIINTHRNVFRWSLLNDPPAYMEPISVRLQQGARLGPAKTPPIGNRRQKYKAEFCRNGRSIVTMMCIQVATDGLEKA